MFKLVHFTAPAQTCILRPVMKTRSTPFRGNKAALPSKPCVSCGLPMSWRRSWAKNWAEVKYCSEACRRAKSPHA